MKTNKCFFLGFVFLFFSLSQTIFSYYPPKEILRDIPDSFITKPKIKPKVLKKKVYNFNKIKIRGNVFNLEIVDTVEKRKKGLMFRRMLPKNNAMLFVFEKPGKYPFWMKNVSMSLDIIWIDSKMKIVHIAHSLSPYSENVVRPSKKAVYVLEINGGLAKKYHFKVGSKVNFMYNKSRIKPKQINKDENEKQIKDGKSKPKDKNKKKSQKSRKKEAV